MTFDSTQNKNQLAITFSARIDHVDRAADETKRFLASFGLDRQFFDVVVGLREALNNAVIRGCDQDQTKNVNYKMQYETDRLIVEVEDEGEGFDWQRYLGKEPPVLAESGRGLPIMEQYFEMIWFNETGNKVVLVKFL